MDIVIAIGFAGDRLPICLYTGFDRIEARMKADAEAAAGRITRAEFYRLGAPDSHHQYVLPGLPHERQADAPRARKSEHPGRRRRL
jgi:hypothetical protein